MTFQKSFASTSRLIIGFAVLFASGALLVTSAPADAAVKQPNCAKQKAKVRKAKGKAKRTARKALKQCQNNRLVYNQVKNARITGVRADGVAVDDIYCANGRWQSDAGSGGKVYRTSWYVSSARVRSPKKFTAVVVGKVAGGTHEIAVARNGKKWKVGWTHFDEPRDLGDATRTGARKLCAGL